MSIDRKIGDSGDARLVVHGLTGGSTYNLGHAPKGLPYEYPLAAHFDATQGTSHWTGSRVCQFTFTKR